MSIYHFFQSLLLDFFKDWDIKESERNVKKYLFTKG